MAVTTQPVLGTQAIRPFTVETPEAQFDDLRSRILATRWPERETVLDDTQGVQLALAQEIARYWTSEYDFGRIGARLNALPQFTTNIDGVDIHFIHVRSRHEDALPVVICHGWPGIDGMTTWNASDALAPCAVGSVSRSMSFSCSMTEPGQPWQMTSGSASSCLERTWMKWMSSPSSSVMKFG